jgi:hypothetical protein
LTSSFGGFAFTPAGLAGVTCKLETTRTLFFRSGGGAGVGAAFEGGSFCATLWDAATRLSLLPFALGFLFAFELLAGSLLSLLAALLGFCLGLRILDPLFLGGTSGFLFLDAPSFLFLGTRTLLFFSLTLRGSFLLADLPSSLIHLLAELALRRFPALLEICMALLGDVSFECFVR